MIYNLSSCKNFRMDFYCQLYGLIIIFCLTYNHRMLGLFFLRMQIQKLAETVKNLPLIILFPME